MSKQSSGRGAADRSKSGSSNAASPKAAPPKSGPSKAAHPRTERPQTAAEARAEYEAAREANKAARQAAMDAAFPDGIPGGWVAALAWIATAVFTLVSIPTVIAPETFIAVYFAVAMGLFLVGCALFAAVIFLMASRSRDDLMGIGGIFLLAGSAPKQMQVRMLAALAVQIVVAIAGAAIHPFTPLAFGTLVPILGLSMCGLWAVMYGHFPAQTPADHK